MFLWVRQGGPHAAPMTPPTPPFHMWRETGDHAQQGRAVQEPRHTSWVGASLTWPRFPTLTGAIAGSVPSLSQVKRDGCGAWCPGSSACLLFFVDDISSLSSFPQDLGQSSPRRWREACGSCSGSAPCLRINSSPLSFMNYFLSLRNLESVRILETVFNWPDVSWSIDKSSTRSVPCACKSLLICC